MIPVELGTAGKPPGTKNALTFRSVVFNNPSDNENDTFHIEEIVESDVFEQSYEPLPNRDGSQGYEPFHQTKLFQVRGWVRAPSITALFDKIEVINKAFHPVNCYLYDTSTFDKGYLPISFNVPTADTTNYPTGLISCSYYVQAIRLPVSLESKFDGFNARIDFLLRAIDPRRYFNTTQSVQRTSNGVIDVDNALASVRSWPTVVIVLPSGAPSGTATIAHEDGRTVSIDLSLLAASTSYTLDMQARTFVKTTDGTDKIAAITGTSSFFDVLPEDNQVVTYAGFAAGTTFDFQWGRAFV